MLSRLFVTKKKRANTRFLLHVGYPRTSTTWLQSDILPHLGGVHYLGYRYEKSHWYQQNLVSEIALSDDAHYHPRTLSQTFDKLMRFDQSNVFSSEAFLSPHDTAISAPRCAEVFAAYDSHVLIGLRRQDHFALSAYYHQLRHFYEIMATKREGRDPVYSIEDCLECPVQNCKWPDCSLSHQVKWQPFKSDRHCDCLDHGCKTLPLWYLDYHKVVTDFQKAFGADRVHIILLEETAKDSLGTIQRVAGLLKSTSTPEHLQQLADIPKRNSLQPFDGIDYEALKKNYYAPGGTASWVLDQCRGSNKKLAALFPAERFADFGYF